MSACYRCGCHLSDPDIGDNDAGGFPAGVGITLCRACYNSETAMDLRFAKSREAAEAAHRHTFTFAGRTVTYDDRDEEDF